MVRPFPSVTIMMNRYLAILFGLSCLLGCDDDADFEVIGGVDRAASGDRGSAAATDAQASELGAAYGGKTTTAEVADRLAVPQRKLVYTSTISLVVADFDAAVQALQDWMVQSDGYVASNRLRSQVANARSGTWVIRVPTDGYETTIAHLRRLGEVKAITENVDDVTEEFVDVEARLANARKLEARIIDLLEDRSGKLSDILEIERELARIREGIERTEGRLRYLTNQTTLATITVELQEQKNFKPEAPLTLSDRLAAAWSNSFADLRTFLAGSAVFLVSVMPWLIIWLPLLLVGFLVVRGMIRRAAAAEASMRPPPTSGSP